MFCLPGNKEMKLFRVFAHSPEIYTFDRQRLTG